MYEELRHRAGRLLGLGESVILDASWQDPSQRAATRAAARVAHAEVIEVQLVLPPSVAAARIEARRRAGDLLSDADVRVATAMAQRSQPWPEAAVVPTDGEVDDAVQAVRVRCDGRAGAVIDGAGEGAGPA